MHEFLPDFDLLKEIDNFDEIKCIVLSPLDGEQTWGYALERLSYLYPKLALFSSDSAENKCNCLHLIFSGKLDFDIEALREKIQETESSKVCFIAPLGYPSLVAFNDLASNCSGFQNHSKVSKYYTVADILKILIPIHVDISIKIPSTILGVYARILASDRFSVARNFLHILRCKEPEHSALNIGGDLPYFFQFTIVPAKRSEKPLLNELKSQCISCDAKINYYAVFDKLIGHEGCFSLVKPVFVKYVSDADKFECVKNNDGFYEKCNERCSELTAIHYILRNYQHSDVLGFCHYRRFLDLTTQDHGDRVYHFDETPSILDIVENQSRIIELLQTNDLIVASPLDLGNSQELHYCLSHYPEDYYLMVTQIIKKYPFLTDALVESMQSNYLYASNLVLGKSGLVQYIFQIMFDVLGIFEQVSIRSRSKYQTRDVAFLSERVFDTILRYFSHNGIIIKVVPRVHLSF